MNDRDRDDRVLVALTELKQELVATNLHLGQINGSMGRHFEEDKKAFTAATEWQLAHDKREDLVKVALAESKGFRRGLMVPLAALVFVMSIVGPALTKLIFEKLL